MISKNDYAKSPSKLFLPLKCEYLVKCSENMDVITLKIMIYRQNSTKKRFDTTVSELYVQY